MKRQCVLVVDDKENIRKLFERILADGFDVKTAEDGSKALALLVAGDVDVVVSDIRMPGLNGEELLEEVKKRKPAVEFILMTAFGSVANAVAAMKAGAYDYLTKPFDPDEARLLVERAAERKRLREQAENLRRLIDGEPQFGQLVGKSASMQRIFALLERAARTDATVLLMGESGTGKELTARSIHGAGPRAEAPFVAVNCGAIPENLIESELFGHVKGSFTGAVGDKRGLFEEADGGTLLLDEIGDLPLALQVKLTRVLQERSIRRVGAIQEKRIDVRLIAATNVDLKAAVLAGKFREDLYYRLNVLPIRLPPLRERREDIPLLAGLFLERYAAATGRVAEGIAPEALSALMRYDWPGNVRELENAVARALVVSDAERIPLEALPPEIATARPSATLAGVLTQLSYRETVELARERAAREYLVALLEECGGNVTRAAVRAGVERESLHRLLKRFGIRADHRGGGQ